MCVYSVFSEEYGEANPTATQCKQMNISSIIVTKYNGLLFKLSRVEIVMHIIRHSQCPRGIPPIVMCNILISNMFVVLNRSEVVTTTPSGELKHFG